jgi:tetratricopeptide (TPR) repeat protein
MTRVYVLTRLIDDAIGTWEYTRFRAEANSVVTRDDPTLLAFLPLPDIKEYAPEEADEADAEEEMTFQRAIEAIRNEDYDPAISFFANLTTARPNYHIGWLRLGHAKREKAMRTWEEAPDEALGLFHEAIDDLTRAMPHRDASGRAQAHYERSKGYYHLARLQAEDGASRDAALSDALEATKLDTNPRYRSWLEYLQRTYGILP